MSAPLWMVLSYQLLAPLALLLGIVGLILRSRIPGIVTALSISALWVARFIVAGHLPLFGAWESVLSLLFFTAVIAGIIQWKSGSTIFILYPFLVAPGLWHGMHYPSEIWALTISEQGVWVHLHAIAAYVAFGFAFALAATAVGVAVGRDVQPKLRTLLLPFFTLYTLMFVLGIFYRFLLFGKAWSFDPVESIHLLLYLLWTTLIHRAFFKTWDEKVLARWIILLFLLLVVGYRIILLFPPSSTYHILDISIRTHIMPGG